MDKTPTELVNSYRAAERDIARLVKERDAYLEKESAKVQAEFKGYNDKIHQLQARREIKAARFTEERDAWNKKESEQIAKLHNENIGNVETIISYLKLKPDVSFADSEIRDYSDRRMKPIVRPYINDPPLLKVVAVISENDRPKNKYTLALVGDCAFDNVREAMRYYGLYMDTPQGTFNMMIDAAPTVEELEKIIDKGGSLGNKRFAEAMALYNDTKKAYQAALATYTLKDFEAVMECVCSKCGDMTTKRAATTWARCKSPMCSECSDHYAPDGTGMVELKQIKR